MKERGMSPTESTVASRAAEPAAPAATEPEKAAPISQRVAGGLWWAARFLLALFLFVGALQLMKTGAAGLDVLQNQGFLVRNAGSTLGLGWIGALFVLSG